MSKGNGCDGKSKFVTYLRVSTARQGASGLGLEAQRAAVASYLNGGAWTLLRELVEVESGKRNDRPKLADALRLCRLHNATLLIAKLDRLSRDAHFLLGLEKAGVDFIAADMPRANRLTVGIMAMVADEERRTISKRTKEALAAKRERYAKLTEEERAELRANGKATRLGAVRWDHLAGEVSQRGNVASIKQRQANASARATDLAPIIAELRADGITTLSGLAAALNARGMPTARGKEGAVWSSVQVQRVLQRVAAERA